MINIISLAVHKLLGINNGTLRTFTFVKSSNSKPIQKLRFGDCTNE